MLNSPFTKFGYLCIYILFLYGLALPAQASDIAFGAAVSWVGYDNRNDFIVDRILLDKIIETPQLENSKVSLFNIPPDRHYKVPTQSSFLIAQSESSFEGNLNRAIDSLIAEVSINKTVAPFLVIAISSHGANGELGLNYNENVKLQDLSRLIIDKQNKFTEQTGHPLRLEIIYSACHSGSLIRIFKDQLAQSQSSLPKPLKSTLMDKNKASISIITTTSEEKIAYSHIYKGDYLLRLLLGVKEGARLISKNINSQWTFSTLADFGFFEHFGAGSFNHPQIFTTLFRWNYKNTFDFFNWYVSQWFLSGSDEGENLTRRPLILNFSDLISASNTIEEVLNIIIIENINRSKEQFKNNLYLYLTDPRDHIRFAAAIFILESLSNNPLIKIDGLELYHELAEIQFNSMIHSPSFYNSLQQIQDNDNLLLNIIDLLPISSKEESNTLQIIETIYRNSGEMSLQTSRKSMDKLREILTKNYHISPKTNFMSRDESRRVSQNLTTIPESLLREVLKYHFGLDPKITETHLILSSSVDLLIGKQKGSRSSPAKASSSIACSDFLSFDHELFIEMVQEVLKRYDSGTYIYSPPGNFIISY